MILYVLQPSCIQVFEDFLRELRRALEAEGVAAPLVLMYDSVTREGKLEWQNQLNERNSCAPNNLQSQVLCINLTKVKLRSVFSDTHHFIRTVSLVSLVHVTVSSSKLTSAIFSAQALLRCEFGPLHELHVGRREPGGERACGARPQALATRRVRRRRRVRARLSGKVRIGARAPLSSLSVTDDSDERFFVILSVFVRCIVPNISLKCSLLN